MGCPRHVEKIRDQGVAAARDQRIIAEQCQADIEETAAGILHPGDARLHIKLVHLPAVAGSGYHDKRAAHASGRSEEHTSELQSLMRSSYAAVRLNKKHH